MKTVIIYQSYHHKNTRKIADHLASELGFESYDLRKLPDLDWAAYDRVILGSGIYYQKLHKNLSRFILDHAAQLKDKQICGLITSGSRSAKYRRLFKGELESAGLNCSGIFHCKGWDTFGPFKLIGGLNKNRPNQRDLEEAAAYFSQLQD